MAMALIILFSDSITKLKEKKILGKIEMWNKTFQETTWWQILRVHALLQVLLHFKWRVSYVLHGIGPKNQHQLSPTNITTQLREMVINDKRALFDRVS